MWDYLSWNVSRIVEYVAARHAVLIQWALIIFILSASVGALRRKAKSDQTFKQYLEELFIIDQKTNRKSHTKLWSNVGFFLLCLSFIIANLVIFRLSVDDFHTDDWIWVNTVFGALVVTQRGISQIIGQKFKALEIQEKSLDKKCREEKTNV